MAQILNGPTMAAAALASLMSSAALADSGSFGEWSVVCDNTRACVALGFGELGQMGSAGHIAISRGAEPDAAATARLLTAGQRAAKVSLAVDGRVPPGLAGLPASALADDDEQRVTELTPAQTQALLGVLVNGSRLSVVEVGEPALNISLAGSSASLRFMDDRQKRAGTSTALVARGAQGAEAVPQPPPPPVVRPAAAVSQANLPSSPPRAIIAQMDGCDDDIAEIGLDPEVARLSGGRLFWGLACSRGAYNVVYRLFLSDETGGQVERLNLGDPSGGSAWEVMNIAYDPQARSLTNFDKARGLGDCGAITHWTWTGRAFELSEQTRMPECKGVLPEHWPVSYRSR